MPSITAIEPQKKKPDRFNVFVDGKFRFGLDAETLVGSGLRVGQEISEKEIEKLVLENETNKLMEKALRFLSFRPRSERELYDYLRRKFSKRIIDTIDAPDTIDTVIDRLKHLGYVDDLKFSQWWVEQRQTHRPRGRQLIKNELYQKGISQETINQVLPEDEESEVGRALQTAKKKLRSYKNLPTPEFKQKMSQYLSRRGFDWETTKEVVDQVTGLK
jgi:regulatory protein